MDRVTGLIVRVMGVMSRMSEAGWLEPGDGVSEGDRGDATR